MVSRQIYLGRDGNGKEIRKRIYAKTKRELELECALAKEEWEQRSEETLSSYSEKWYKETKASVSLNTKLMYENLLKHIKESPQGGIGIKDIKLSDLQNLINLHKGNPNICRKLRMCLNSVLEYALMNGEIRANPAKSIILPKQPRVERNTFTDSQISKINEAALSEGDKSYAYTLYYFGLRPAEVLALRKKDFDFEKGTLTIKRAVAFDRDGNTPYIKETKTGNTRVLPVTNPAKEQLKSFIDRQKDYIFTMENGSLITKSSNVKRWKRIVKEWNKVLSEEEKLPEKVKPYCFRYTYATKLYYSGITIKKASELMGHSDTTMLLQVYAQLDNSKENLDMLNDVFDNCSTAVRCEKL